VVIDGGKPEYVQGDFLVRGLVGADPDDGRIAVAPAAPGQVVRLHARDARSADRDLREAPSSCAARRSAVSARRRARVHLQRPRARHVRHGRPRRRGDRRRARRRPRAGFFAAGEIGPVGGEAFLHAFTATLAVFAR
jgi:small ligand-binding sensory domain FIST